MVHSERPNLGFFGRNMIIIMKTVCTAFVLATILLSGCMTSKKHHESKRNAEENRVVVIIVPVTIPRPAGDSIPAPNNPNLLDAGSDSTYSMSKFLRSKQTE